MRAPVDHSEPPGSGIEGEQVLVFVNPVAGQSEAEQVCSTVEQFFGGSEGRCRIHELRKEGIHERIAEELARARRSGCRLFVAAGGDGTVAMVADAMIRAGMSEDCLLGILPLGTSNLLARELGIPVSLEEACQTILQQAAVHQVDAMKIKDRYYFLRIGIGLDAVTMRDTSREAKRRFGRLAYITTFFQKLAGYGRHHFSFDVDGEPVKQKAWQAIVANCGGISMQPLRLGPGIDPTDGQLDLCVFDVRKLIDYPRLLVGMLIRRWGAAPTMRYYPAIQRVRIETRRPLAVQADGEPLGHTPVEVDLVRGAVRIIGGEKLAQAED